MDGLLQMPVKTCRLLVMYVTVAATLTMRHLSKFRYFSFQRNLVQLRGDILVTNSTIASQYAS